MYDLCCAKIFEQATSVVVQIMRNYIKRQQNTVCGKIFLRVDWPVGVIPEEENKPNPVSENWRSYVAWQIH